jgi:O-acetylserine/cysteine efflux transporter
LRFTLVAFPAVFLLKRPPIAWRHLAAYGLFTNAGQFALLYLAVRDQISPGLASLVIQTQVVFTIGLSMLLGGERLRLYQAVAVLLAGGGVALIALRAGGTATPLGLGLVIGAAFFWGSGNIMARRAGRINMLAFVVWSSLFSIPPLLALSLLLDGWPAIRRALLAADAATWSGVLWQSVGNTMFGYAAWSWLLARHSAVAISPLALLVPLFGMGASAIWLGEALPLWKIAAAGLVLCGLALNFFWPLRHHVKMAPQPSE